MIFIDTLRGAAASVSAYLNGPGLRPLECDNLGLRNLSDDDPEVIAYAESLIRERASKRFKARGIDGGGTARNKGLGVVQFNCLGQVPGTANDQWWFFSQISDLPVDATYTIGTITPAASRYTNAQVADYFTWNVTYCANANINGMTAAALSGAQLVPFRTSPYGQQAQDTQYQNAYQDAYQYQTNRGQFPIDDMVDGETYFRLTAPATNPADSFNISFFMGPRHDRRLDAKRGVPVTVNAPGGK